MAKKNRKLFADPEKRAKTYFLAWIISMAVMILGYVIIFYILFYRK